MISKLDKIVSDVKEQLSLINDDNALKNLKSSALGKKSEINTLMSSLKDLSPEQRPKMGQLINQRKVLLNELFNQKEETLKNIELEKKLKEETIDVTLPGIKVPSGSNHLLKNVIEDFEGFFIGLGYEVKEGPEVESDLYNFEMLNIGKDHPARAMHDTFYINETTLLRSHTSPVQIRTMLKANGKPIKIICPGKVYRRDDDDQYHSHQFMQIEGLVIDEDITMADLNGTLNAFINYFFGEEKEIRLRPSYFPFTEPSVEVDVYNGEEYIEILGAGMVHPNVLEMAGYDSSKMRGFAFGIGVERLAMLKYEVDDIRRFYTNDIRFLNQFKGGRK